MNPLSLALNPNKDFLDLAAKKNTALQQIPEDIKQNSWLEIGHPMGEIYEIDSELFGELTADFLGISGSSNLQDRTFNTILAAYANLPQEEQVPEVLALIYTQRDIKRLHNNSADVVPILDYVEYHKKVWFPLQLDANQAFPLTIQINLHDNSVTVFNIGVGSQLHLQTKHQTLDPLTGQPILNTKILPYYKIANCNPDILRSREFYQFLNELQKGPSELGNAEEKVNFLYQGLENFLEGKVEENLDIAKEEDVALLRKPQRTHSSTSKNLLTAIQSTLLSQPGGKAKYKKFKFLLQSQALVSLAKKEIDISLKKVIQSVIQNMARATLKEPLKSSLTENELVQWKATLEDIQAKLSRINEAPLPDVNPKSITNYHYNINIPSLSSVYSGINERNQNFQVDLNIGSFKPVEYIPTSYADLDLPQLIEKFSALTTQHACGSDADGEIVEIFSLIVQKIKEDPLSKLAGFSINLKYLKEHLKNPYTIYTNPKTHEVLDKACEYLRQFGDDNAILQFNNDSLTISDYTRKKDTTLVFLSQFLKEDEKEHPNDALARLITSNDELPESVRTLFKVVFECKAYFEGKKGEYEPKKYDKVISPHYTSNNAIVYWKFPNYRPENQGAKKPLTDDSYKLYLESKTSENALVSGRGNGYDYGGYYYSGLNLDTRTNRQMKMIGLDRANIPNQLIAFFSTNIELLSKSGMTSFFLSQLLRPFALLKQIQMQPLFLNKLEDFCRNTIHHFIQKGDYGTAFNCILLTHRIEAFLKLKGIATDFPNLRKVIFQDLLSNASGTLNTATRADIIKIYLSEMTTKESPTYNLDLAIYLFTCKVSHSLPDDQLEKDYLSKKQEIENDGELKKQVAQFFQLDSDQCQIDFDKVTIVNVDGSPFFDQIKEIKSHPFYQSYFNRGAVQWTEVPSQRLWIPPHYVLTSGNKTLTLKMTPIPHFCKTFGGQEYTYQERCVEDSSIFGTTGTLWIKEDNPNKKYLLDDKTEQLGFEITYGQNWGWRGASKAITQIVRLADNAKYIQHSTIPGTYAEITNCWTDAALGITKEFMFGYLKFARKNVNNQNYLFCEQYPGYFLVDNFFDANFSSNHITIKNMAGQLKVIPQIIVRQNNETISHLIECNVVDGKLVAGHKVDDQLFLIEHYIQTSDYQSACDLIKGLNFFDRLCDDKKTSRVEATQMRGIIAKLSANQNNPDCLALMLHLLKLELQNRMKFPSKIGQVENNDLPDEKVLTALVSSYLEVETNCTFCRLSAKEKLELVTLLQENFPTNPLFPTICQEWFGRVVVNNPTPPQEDNSNILNMENDIYFVEEGLVFPCSYFAKNYTDLLDIIEYGNLEQKKWLNNVLKANFAYNKTDVAFNKIYLALNFPNLPSFFGDLAVPLKTGVAFFSIMASSLVQVFAKKTTSEESYEWQSVPKPLTVDTNAMEEADQNVDAYLKGLVSKYFTAQILPPVVFNDLLPTNHASPTVKARLEKENQELVEYRTEILKPEQIIKISQIQITALKAELNQTKNGLSENLKTMKAALLWQINSGNVLIKLGKLSPLKWKDLQKLSLSGDFEQFKKTTQLEQNEAEKTLRAIGYYLILESRTQQMANALALIARAEKEGIHSPRGQLLITQCHEIMTLFTSETRNYNQVDRLWFECANKYLYRTNQIEKLKEILEADYAHLQAEMPTGYGKTKTIVPSLNQTIGRQGKAVVNCWPATLETTNIVDTNNQMNQSFAKQVDRLAFDRSSNFTANNLAAIYRGLCEDKENGKPINCCPEAIRALELHFLLTLDSPEKDDKKLEYFRKILSFFRNEAWATIDEEHVLLSPMDRLIYTLGEDTHLPNHDVRTIQSLFKMLLKEPLKSKIDVLNQSQNSLDDVKYREVSQTLAESFYTYFKCTENKEEFIAFVTGEEEKEPSWLSTHPKKEQFSLVKGMLCFILQLSLQAKIDENFGLSHEHADTIEFAIAYSSADTPKETASGPSQYKNPHETLIKTHLTYLYKGLNLKQVKNYIKDLQEESELEMSQGIPFANTQAGKIYNSFKLNYPKPLNQLNAQDMDNLYDQVKHHPGFILQYIKKRIVPQIKIFEESISSDAQNFRSQFNSTLSLSATPQHQLAHGHQTKFIPMKGTSGQVTHLLLTKCVNPNDIHRLQGITSKEAVTEVNSYLADKPEIKAVVDIGAQTKGLTNLEVAKQFSSDPNVKGVLFFDEKEGIFKLLDSTTGCILDYSESNMTPEERRTFYDQSRCFGSDIPQSCDAVAMLLTSAENTKAEVGQALGRMRQIHKGQQFAVSTPEKLNEKQSIQDLLVYWIANHSNKEAFLNYQSQVQQYDNLLRRSVLDNMLKADYPLLVVKQIFKLNRSLFITKENVSSYVQYAHAPKASKTENVLESKQKAVSAKIDEAWLLSSAERKELKEKLKSLSYENIPLPATVASNTGLGMECEVLQEVETEVELELENQTVFEEPYAYVRHSFKWDKKLNLFEKGWEGSGNLYPLFKWAISSLLSLPNLLLTAVFSPNEYHQALTKFGPLLDEVSTLAGRIKDVTLVTILPSLLGSIVGTPIAVVSYIGFNALMGVSTTYLSYQIALYIAAAATYAVLNISLTIAVVSVPIFAISGVALPVSYAVKRFCTYLKRNYYMDNFICRVDEVMQMHLKSSLYPMHQLFSPNFYASNNFYRQNSLVDVNYGYGGEPEESEVRPQAPLQSDQKQLSQVLLIEDTDWYGTKELKMVAIDTNDSPFFRRKLENDRKTSEEVAALRTRRVAIYDITNEMIVANGKNDFSLDELKQRPEFHEMLASAKLLSGAIAYSDEELEYLQKKVDTLGKKEVREFFVNRILKPYQPKNLRCLKIQPIGKMLKDKVKKAA